MSVWGYLGLGILCVSGFIILLALLYNFAMIKLAARFSGKTIEQNIDTIAQELPGTNCGACGCENCRAYAYAVFACQKEADLCIPGGPEVAEKLKFHMEEFEKLLNDEEDRKKKDWFKEMEVLRERKD